MFSFKKIKTAPRVEATTRVSLSRSEMSSAVTGGQQTEQRNSQGQMEVAGKVVKLADYSHSTGAAQQKSISST